MSPYVSLYITLCHPIYNILIIITITCFTKKLIKENVTLYVTVYHSIRHPISPYILLLVLLLNIAHKNIKYYQYKIQIYLLLNRK